MTAYPFKLLQEHYKLAGLAKDKLNQCISPRRNESNLREVVGHANLLGRVLSSIDKIKYDYVQEQERKFRERSGDFYQDSLYGGDNYSYVDRNTENDNDSIFTFEDGYETTITGKNTDIDNASDTRSGKGSSEDIDGLNKNEEEKEENVDNEDFIFTFSENFPSSQIRSSLPSPDNSYFKCRCNSHVNKTEDLVDVDHHYSSSKSLYIRCLDKKQSFLISKHMIRFLYNTVSQI